MKQNHKLSLALHALGHMACTPDAAMTSEVIAKHHATNPVVVRRVLGLLRACGIVQSAKGHAGGWMLARQAAEISVAEVYLAVGAPFLEVRPLSGNPGCAIVAALNGVVSTAMLEAEVVLVRHLALATIADLAAGMTMQKTAFHLPESPL